MDDALSGYSAAEPVAGLEERVLNRIRIAEASRRRSWFVRWAFAFPVLASLLVAAVVLRTTPAEQRLDLAPPPIASAPPVVRPVPVSKRERHWSAPRPPAATEQERALLTLATCEPEALQALADLQKKSNETLEIQAIQIAPLESDGNQTQ